MSNVKKRGLGKNNLSALLSDLNEVVAPSPAAIKQPEKKTTEKPNAIALEKLVPGVYQPRDVIEKTDNLAALAESIKKHGVIQPIVVRRVKSGEDKYEIIAGERRWRAAKLANLKEVPIIVKALSDENALAVALIENIQREDLSALMTAKALHRFVAEFSLTHEQVGKLVGKSRASVSNFLRILSLEPAVKTLLEQHDLEFGHAKALLALKGFDQINAAQKVRAENLSVRATEKLVASILEPTQKKNKPKAILDPDIARLQTTLSEHLGAPVSIAHKKGKGKVTIPYSSLDELEGVLERLKQ